jgi:hypothetical protein
MKQKTLLSGILALTTIMLLTSTAFGVPPVKYSPSGTWEYALPGVPDEYSAGWMVVAEAEEGIVVSIGPSTDYMVEAEYVEYSKKELKFKIYVENEEVNISGTFKGDEFTGTVSYVEGVFDLTARRVKE